MFVCSSEGEKKQGAAGALGRISRPGGRAAADPGVDRTGVDEVSPMRPSTSSCCSRRKGRGARRGWGWKCSAHGGDEGEGGAWRWW